MSTMNQPEVMVTITPVAGAILLAIAAAAFAWIARSFRGDRAVAERVTEIPSPRRPDVVGSHRP